MIPVFQTRHAVETFGNCFEACLASILELPLAAVPDRAQYVDHDAWADRVSRCVAAGADPGDLELPDEYEAGIRTLKLWLLDRGLGWVEVEIGRRALRPHDWFTVVTESDGYWIGEHDGPTGYAHAVVWKGDEIVHDPSRTAKALFGKLLRADLLVAWDAPAIARLDPLPDIAGQLDQAAA